MSTKPRCQVNPFESPVKNLESSPSTILDDKARKPAVEDVLSTADLFHGQLKELEDLCSTVEERVRRKRQALKELEYLISGFNTNDKSPYSPPCPENTPIRSRLCLVSPRLRGLFDLRGPGQLNHDAMQTCLDYSPESQTEFNLSAHDNPASEHSEEWIDDEEALISPFDDKYALGRSPLQVEKELPAIPHYRALESKIPRNLDVRRQMSASKKITARAAGAMARSISRGYRSGVKTPGTPSDVTSKGTMRRGSWKRSVENARKRGGAKSSETNENESLEGNARKKERRKGLWSIYSVCSEISGGVNGAHYYHAI